MRKANLITGILISLLLSAAAFGQKETYTGTAVIYGTGTNTRTVTRSFQLNINGTTSDQKAMQFLEVLQSNGQDSLLKQITNEDLGRFSLGDNVGTRINVVRENMVDGKKHILVVFERLLGFGEVRNGYRSVDYPFSFLEIYVDEKTGNGDGTFIPAARIRFKMDKDSNENQVEIENFATFPAKLMGIKMRNN